MTENEQHLGIIPQKSEQELREILAKDKVLPEVVMVRGHLSAEFLHKLSKEATGEHGLVVTTDGRKILFRGGSKDYTPSPRSICEKLGINKVKIFLHTHQPFFEYDDALHILDAPSSSDFRVSATSQKLVDVEVLVAGDLNIQYRAGQDVDHLEYELLFDFLGKSKEDFVATDELVLQYVPTAIPGTDDFEHYRQDAADYLAFQWYKKNYDLIQSDKKQSHLFSRYVRDKIRVDDPATTTNSFTRIVSDEELEQMINL